LYVVIRSIGLLPRWLLQGLGRAFGVWLYMIRSRSRRITEINLGLCLPELSADQQAGLARSSLLATAQTAFETPAVWCKKSKHLLTWIDNIYGQEVLDEALSRGQGVVLLMPHIGNWELFNAVYAENHGPLTALFKPPKQASLARVIRRARMHYGNEMVPTSPRGLVRLFKTLAAGGTVAVLPDQVPESGCFVPFMGQSALTDRLAYRLVAKSGATPIMVALIRNPKGLFDVFYEPLPGLVASVEEAMALKSLNDALEGLIRRFPAQYQWEYKRFKKQPDGLLDPYKSRY